MGALRANFGRRIQQLRKAAGLTQEKLAQRAGMDYKYLGGVERGERNLTIDNVERIIKALGVAPYEPFMIDLSRPAAEPSNERILLGLIRHTDPSIRPLITEVVQSFLRWDRGRKKS